MASMTYAEAAEQILRETRAAMPIKALWAEISKRGLVATEGERPEATLQVELSRRSANSTNARLDGPPRFYRRGDGAYGLLAHLIPEQQRAVMDATPTDSVETAEGVIAPELTLEELVDEYIGEYLPERGPQAFLAGYKTERTAARANLQRIEGLEQRGEDPTDAILLGLLPHTDTAAHRRQNAWICHAPAIQGDVRVWFERSGWVRGQDWPRIASLILRFVRDNVRKPSQLIRHIAAFTADPLSKGFSVGMLTPILNALAPDHYPICNKKAIRVVSYFAEVELAPTFEDYPAMIEQFRRLVASLPLLHEPNLGGKADDLFDYFCHWLIAVRKYSFPDAERLTDDEDDDPLVSDDATPPPPPPPPPYTIDDALGRVFLSREELTRLLDLLQYKRNLVLQGPPGVGKTFVAADLAYVLLGAVDEDRIKRVQFHQSYAYEDFVRGYRPSLGGGFEYRDGPMLEFCERARRDPDGRPHVMIIDEINRGNLSKILGELMLLIEPDKREPRWALDLAYARPGEPPFWVPKNLFVIGTMNTADRSLALVDYALRRRFAFASVQPAFGQPFRDFLAHRGAPAESIDKIFAKLAKLNAEIEKDTRNLGRGYVIGHSYFCQEDPAGTYGAAWYERIVRFEIQPLLEEYFAEDPDKVKTLVGALLS